MECVSSPELEAFRQEVRKLIAEIKTPDLVKELEDSESAAMRGGPALRKGRDQVQAR